MMLGLDNPYGEETAHYESTTRARALAPKLMRMIEKAEGTVTVLVTGVELAPEDATAHRWSEALEAAARVGAKVRHYLPPGTSEAEAAIAEALAERYPLCECIAVSYTQGGAMEALYPTLAWEGALDDPRQALLWLEEAREPDETETSAEFRDTRNLRRNAGMLKEFVRSVQSSARRTSGTERHSISAG